MIELINTILIFCSTQIPPNFDKKKCVEHIVNKVVFEGHDLEDAKEYWVYKSTIK